MMYNPITTTNSPALLSLFLATTLLSLFTSPTSAQQFFHISPFYAQDGSWITDTPEDIDHSLTFNISRPGAAGTQGGNGEAECRFSWTGSIPPSCYQACSPTSLSTTGGGSQFYARVTPGYQNMIAKNISIDILQSYSYRNFVLQNGTFSLQEESPNGENAIPGCYRCEQRYYRGYTTEECSLRNVSAGVDVPVEAFGYGIWPVGSVVDVCGE
ncbi:uncharacterized protein SEPMUDRAFT_150613 [Sphaerulina musiva SO2202]|uniref:Uncharacterized protein n=1 Tax=Sphaerulina musiva (strain SO2202) TaxID=692275 RepID=N1QIX1_SPHMS|nr:uncharacterized protein SEPMUDRAFT_150613 [Sphaerulina musiva SO2202]EMF10534.1 hypothetical protein SEPMUDRAFT_150613 [Sphaerulina musiva SO2202]